MQDPTSLIERLARLQCPQARSALFADHPILNTTEGARLICRASVAFLYRDLRQAEALCDALDQLAAHSPHVAVAGYRDHARAAYLQFTGAGPRSAAPLWLRAIRSFEAADLTMEAAITSSCAIPDFAFLGDIDQAKTCESRASRYFQSTTDRLRLARLRQHTAFFHVQRDEWQAAIHVLEGVYEDFVASGPLPTDLCVVMNNLAVCHMNCGDLPRANYLLSKCRALCEEHSLLADLSRFYGNLVEMRFLEGDLASALELVHQQLEHESRREHHLYHHAALNEARILLALSLPDEAYERALVAYRGYELLGMSRDVARALTVIGKALAMRRQTRAAVAKLEQAKHVLRSIGNVQAVLHGELEKAKVLLDEGAVDSSARIADSLHQESIADPYAQIDLLLLQARLDLTIGRSDDALARAQRAFVRSSMLGYGGLESDALRLLGDIHESMGQAGLAEDVLVRSQLTADRLRRGLPTGDLQIAFLSDKSDLFQSRFVLSLKSNGSAESLLYIAEASKSRALAETLNLRQGCGLPAGSGTCRSELLELWQSLRGSLNHLEAVSSGHQSRPQSESIRSAVAAAERAARRVIGRIDLTTNQPTDGVAPLQEVRASLPAHVALVEYYAARGSLFVFVLTENRLQLVELSSVASVRRLCRLALFSLRRPPQKRVKQDEALLSNLVDLHSVLWAPIAEEIGARNVVVVPHGFLHHFPFHSLFDGRAFLADERVITYCPSATVFRTLRARPAETATKNVVVGIPSAQMPAIADEVREVAQILPNSTLFLNGDASRGILAQALPGARIIHLAGHGAFSAKSPHTSSVLLGDGPVTAHDLEHMDLSAELVVLSGCETGLNALRGCDEVVGLTQALLQAGARSALASLWSVADDTTADFMCVFHRQLAAGSSRGESLREAMLFQKDSHPHPSRWAAFILVGDPGEAKPTWRRQPRNEALQAEP